jgi:pimeloyl-ACP methyl ester carboxylesterase
MKKNDRKTSLKKPKKASKKTASKTISKKKAKKNLEQSKNIKKPEYKTPSLKKRKKTTAKKTSAKEKKPVAKKTTLRLLNAFLILVMVAVFAYIFTAPLLFKYHYNAELKKSNLKVNKIQYDNDHFEYVEGGQGNETLLFVHGFQSNKEFWIPYFKKYHKDYKIVALDLPAHGKSSSPKNQKYDLLSLSKSLELFVEKTNLNNFHLISTSMGGGIAAVYTFNNPEKVKSLVLLNPLGIDQEEKSDLQHLMDKGENILFPKNLKQFDQMMEYVIGKPVNFNAYFKEYMFLKLMQKYPLHKKAFAELITKSKPVDDILPKIKTNSLIIIGQKDRIIHPNSYEYFISLMPNVKAYKMKKAPHVFVEKYFDKANIVMETFLKENSYN